MRTNRETAANNETGVRRRSRERIADGHIPGCGLEKMEKLEKKAGRAIDLLKRALDALVPLIERETFDGLTTNEIIAGSVRVRFMRNGEANECRLSDIIALGHAPTAFEYATDHRDERRVYMRVHRDVRADLLSLEKTMANIAQARKRQAEGSAE